MLGIRALGPAATAAALFTRKASWILAICVALMLWGATSASAAVSWVGTPTTIHTGGGVLTDSPTVGGAMDSEGDSVAFGGQGDSNPNQETFAVSRPSGGGFSSPQKFAAGSFPSCSSSQLCTAPVGAGVDNVGNSYMFTWSYDGTSTANSRAQEWILPAGSSTWTGPTAITSEAPFQGSLSAAVSPGGLEVVAWGNGTQVRVAMRSPGGSWPATATTAATPGHPPNVNKIAIDANGDVAVGYTWVNGTQTHSSVTFLPAGSSTWSDQDLFSTHSAIGLDIGIDSSGNVTAVFTRDTTGSNAWAFSYETRSFLSGTWSAPTTLDSLGSNSFTGHVAVNASGAAAAVWTNRVGANDVPEMSARANSTAAFDTPTDPFASPADAAAVGVDPAGTATALFVASSGGALEGARHPQGGSWTMFSDTGAPTSVGAGTVAMREDAQGNAIVAYLDNIQSGVFTIGLAMGGPDLSSATIPSTSTSGTPVPFSVTPKSTWGTVSSTSVDFGDGSGPFNGTSGTHTYTIPGVYTVTFSSVDSFGNTSTKQLPITVTSAGGGGGGGGTGGGGGGGTGGGGGGSGGGGTTHVPAKPHLGHKINRGKHTATFTFKAAGARRFGCALVKLKRHKKPPKPRYSLCRSPKKYKRLKGGSYEFFVRGANGAGSGRPATFKFRI